MEINEVLTTLKDEFKTFSEKYAEQVKSIGSATTETSASLKETKEALDKIRTDMLACQTQMDAMDKRIQTGAPGGEKPKTLSDLVFAHPKFVEAKEHEWRGRTPVSGLYLESSAFPDDRKAVSNIFNTTIGSAVTGVMPIQRLPGVYGLPKIALRIRDIMPVMTMSAGLSFDFVVQNTRTNAASPQAYEASPKTQSFYNWTSASDTVQTIAHYVKLSRQALSDNPWLRSAVDGELTYGLKVKEELEILSGDHSAGHLNGIITQATAFDTTLLIAANGWQQLDILRLAKLQARLFGLATYAPSGMVLHPTDLARIELRKDTLGRYLVSDPITGTEITYIWGLPVVESDSIASGTFLVGSFATGAMLIDRQQVSIDISFEDASNFTTNMATVLCEERLGLAVTVPGSFIKGSFNTSP